MPPQLYHFTYFATQSLNLSIFFFLKAPILHFLINSIFYFYDLQSQPPNTKVLILILYFHSSLCSMLGSTAPPPSPTLLSARCSTPQLLGFFLHSITSHFSSPSTATKPLQALNQFQVIFLLFLMYLFVRKRYFSWCS